MADIQLTVVGARPYQFRWAGGKRWLSQILASHLTASAFDHGVSEPFAGGAAMTFASGSRPGKLIDANADLITAYHIIKEDPNVLAEKLAGMPISKNTYDEVVACDSRDIIERAARFIYLNRTGWGGLWRVNRHGRYNVPFLPRERTQMPDLASLMATSDLLQTKELSVASFPHNVNLGRGKQLMYVDPPYVTPKNARQGSFDRYSQHRFTWKSQIALVDLLGVLAQEDQRIIVSNAWHPELVDRYRRAGFRVYAVTRRQNLACARGTNAEIRELLALGPGLRWKRVPGMVRKVA